MMKEIVIAQPLGVSKETLDTLLAPLTGRGYHLTLGTASQKTRTIWETAFPKQTWRSLPTTH